MAHLTQSSRLGKSTKQLLGAWLVAWTVVAAADNMTPTQVVSSKIDELQALIEQHGDEYRRDPSQFYRVVDELVAPAFDLDAISERVAGNAWRPATDEQRAQFRKAFKDRLIVFYGEALLERARKGQSGWKLSEIDLLDGTATVRAKLPQNDGNVVSLGFEMRLDSQGRWLVRDMSVDGVSLVQNFRAQFAPVLRKGGLGLLVPQLEKGALSTGTWRPGTQQ
jgi:phospholipid transport system substrate-binding protein